MKIRQGFVSNSSSSSYLILYDKKDEYANITSDTKYYFNFHRFIDKFEMLDSENEIVATGFYSCKQYLPELTKIIDELEKENGKNIMLIEIAYTDSISHGVLKSLADNDQIKIIKEETF